MASFLAKQPRGIVAFYPPQAENATGNLNVREELFWQTRHGQPLALPGIVALHQEQHLRPRAHQAHVAPGDVPELGQLVEAGAAQEAAHRGEAIGVVAGAVAHGAELVEGERTAAEARPLLAEQDRTAHGPADHQRDHAHGDGGHHQARGGAEHVDQPLQQRGSQRWSSRRSGRGVGGWAGRAGGRQSEMPSSSLARVRSRL